LSASASNSPLVISHRCLGFGHPENTLKAIRDALASAVDGIEVDLRLTKDRKWVIIYNPFLKSEERKVMRVHEHTFSRLRQEAMQLDTFLALAAVEGSKRLVLDIKDVGEEKQILKLLDHYNLFDRTILISWEPEVLKRLHARLPGLKLGFSYVPIASSLRYVKGSVSKPLSKYGVLMSFNSLHSFDVKHKIGKHHHFLSDIPDLPLYSIQVPAFLCSNDLVMRAHAKGVRVIPFGVNSRLTYLLLKRRKIDGIITNNPKLFL
jgi:glycerophosphoryl diester phosphodiesterase